MLLGWINFDLMMCWRESNFTCLYDVVTAVREIMGTYYIISIHAVSVFILEPWMFLRYHLIFDTIPMIYSSVFFFFFFCSYGLMRQETHRLQPLKRKRLISLKSILRYKCVQKQSFCKPASGLLQKNNTEL